MDPKSYPVKSSAGEARTPEEIRNDIDATRAALDRTVTAIEHRLQPRHLYEDARSAAAERMRRASLAAREAARSTAERAVSLGYRTADRVRESPATAIGATVGVIVAVMVGMRGVRRLRQGRRAPRRGMRPDAASVRSGEAQAVTNRSPWRRSAAIGVAAAALGACGSYAARSRRS
jgi:ElaB/YqjD/DUF883 family membrane-anchored ribosome-binding protein